MKNFLLGLIFGLIVVVAAIWYYADQRKDPTAEQAKTRIESTATQVKESVQDKLNWKNLSTDEIKSELARTGQVMRQKARETGNAVSDASSDARITAAIKAKLLADPDLSALSISVNTTVGRVTLSGTASSPENIRKAMLLALDTPGVQEVVSTLQVKQ